MNLGSYMTRGIRHVASINKRLAGVKIMVHGDLLLAEVWLMNGYGYASSENLNTRIAAPFFAL